MAGTWTSERFPQFEQAIRRLTEEHRELEDEPLHLAVSYGPERDPHDIFLMEVIGSPVDGEVNPEHELFETTFAPTHAFPNRNERLHLILTTPQELETALREDWPSVAEILNAIRQGDYAVLHADALGSELLNLIQSEIHRSEVAPRG